MIILYKGARLIRGRGKTLTMVKDGLQYYLEGYKILRNFRCKFGEYIENEEILDLNKSSQLNNCVLLIDEIQIFFDNRRSMTKQNITFSNFVQQIRKRNIIILCTTQYSNTIDIRLRQHLDIIAFPNFKKNLNICEVTYMDLTRLQDNDLILGTNTEFRPALAKIVFNAEPIFKLYNTQEMIV
jgi:hypothetical protein